MTTTHHQALQSASITYQRLAQPEASFIDLGSLDFWQQQYQLYWSEIDPSRNAEEAMHIAHANDQRANIQAARQRLNNQDTAMRHEKTLFQHQNFNRCKPCCLPLTAPFYDCAVTFCRL